MTGFDNPMLLRIYTDRNALHGDRRAFEVVVERARRAGLVGATVLRGEIGYGRGGVHAHHLFGIDDNPPVVVEIVDSEPALRSFVLELSDLRGIGLATLERVEIVIPR